MALRSTLRYWARAVYDIGILYFFVPFSVARECRYAISFFLVLDLELVPEFLTALAREGRITLHAALLAADNGHHAAEAVFKGLGRALRQALTPSEGPVSSKDVTP